MRESITVTSCALPGDATLYSAVSGKPLPADYAGYCQVGLRDHTTAIFRTQVHEGERHWWAVGNNPAAELTFADPKVAS